MNLITPTYDNVQALRELWKKVFMDTDDFLDIFFEKCFLPSRSKCIIVDNRAVAMLYWLDCSCKGEKIAYIYAVATDERFRKKGLSTLLIDQTHRELSENGYAYSVLVPSSPSLFSFYEKKGYKNLTYINSEAIVKDECSYGIKLLPISFEEYCEKRRKLLMASYIEYGAEFNALLPHLYNFSQGDGFILAYRKEGSLLFCPELLGEIDNTSAILSALDCEKGILRHSSGDKPFSMYCKLTERELELPIYFGFALD